MFMPTSADPALSLLILVSRGTAVPQCTYQPNGAIRQLIGLWAGSYPRLPFHPGSLVSLQGAAGGCGCANDLLGSRAQVAGLFILLYLNDTEFDTNLLAHMVFFI